MKTILLIFIAYISLNAETIYNGKCVKSFTLMISTNIYIVYYNDTTTVIPYDVDTINTLVNNVDKWEFIAPKCVFKTANYNNLGLTENQFNFLSALTGLLTSILLVFIIFLKV